MLIDRSGRHARVSHRSSAWTDQDLFRGQFDRLQVAELASDRATMTARQRALREAAIVEVAAMLVAVSPITSDPQLVERWWDDLDDDMVAIAREAAWNM